MRMSGAFDLMRLTRRRHALILTYHRFSSSQEGGQDPGKTPASVFAEQLEYLRSRYAIVSLAELAEGVHDQGRQGRRAPTAPRLAAITIDDGYRDAYEIAYPILRRSRTPATLL